MGTLTTDTSRLTQWPYDQYYISNFVYANVISVNPTFLILNSDVINSPDGLIIRHNWNKTQKMLDDMNNIINGIQQSSNISFEMSELIQTSYRVIGKKYHWRKNSTKHGYISFINNNILYNNHNSNVLETTWGNGTYSTLEKNLVKCTFGGYDHIVALSDDVSSFSSVRTDHDICYGK